VQQGQSTAEVFWSALQSSSEADIRGGTAILDILAGAPRS